MDHIEFEEPLSYELDFVEIGCMKTREKIILEGEPEDGDGNDFLNVCLPVLLFIYIFTHSFINSFYLLSPSKNLETFEG